MIDYKTKAISSKLNNRPDFKEDLLEDKYFDNDLENLVRDICGDEDYDTDAHSISFSNSLKMERLSIDEMPKKVKFSENFIFNKDTIRAFQYNNFNFLVNSMYYQTHVNKSINNQVFANNYNSLNENQKLYR